MDVIERQLYTVAVFQDAASAARGVSALLAEGFPVGAVSTVAVEAAQVSGAEDRVFGPDTAVLEVRGLGRVSAGGSAVAVLQGQDAAFEAKGLAAAASRLGFQPHDGRIFELLVARGGTLVAVAGADRAADALAVLHAYGGGNAAIGAWADRVHVFVS